ncbi:oligosaccharide flippase family protein [Prevotella sp. KH2C16]|uniref:oligosaccharide flippase family protein n=1 Tax=Prevotella sp. KH2C16 TaxID=1855325 RepID=UPI0008E48F4F|nr:oligosaccharide flippase family protein [Prevotella sp. KH2C16]SFF98036.1 Membrane protein involved in the export of O-antigen and teichoic acid [Prevotella sp. KH2C16]
MSQMENKDTSYHHILKYTGIFGGVEGVNIMVGIIRNKLVAMILGPNGMGLVSLFNSTIKLLSDSTNFGIAMSGVKQISENYDQQEEKARLETSVSLIRSWAFLTALLGMVLCVVLSPLLNGWTFNWGDHTLHFVFLSPVVALMAVTGGEAAILKGLRQLRSLAKISVYNVIGALFTSVPIYYFYGESGIVPSLFIMALVQMLLTIGASYRLYPPRLSFSRQFLQKGMNMIRLGGAFVLAGIMGSGAEFIIRSFLNNAGSLETVGLYNAGYMIIMTYAGMVFSAMETDYFPRLSSIQSVGDSLNACVNRQIEVSVLLVSPLLVALMIAVPILLPLLYSGEFLFARNMIQVAIFAMYLRAITLPMAYLPLAKGDSVSYLLMEAVYDISVVLLVICGFKAWGLWGAGLALTLASVLELMVLCAYMHWKYGYRLGSLALKYASIQFLLGLMSYVVVCQDNPVVYWLFGGALFGASLCYSVIVLKSKTHLWESLKRRIKR